jgi:hypothetical protein
VKKEKRKKLSALGIRQNQSTTENCENRNDPDLVQAFLKKWWVESDFNACLVRIISCF